MGSAPPPRPRRRFRPSRYQVTIAAVIAAAGTIGGALIAASSGNSGSSQDKCPSPAVQLSAPDKAGSTFQTTAKVICPPAEGTKYYLIAQMDNVGKPGTEHTVYCPKDSITPGEEARTYTTTRDIHDSPLRSKRALYYLKVTTDEEQELLSNLHDTCAWKLPPGAETVSNSVTVEHGWQ
ncbi:hypothetical protein AB0I22_37130 [Streptomyces sp. NPDC050610]|uniref:hypothetical protein n=1 Tax=Streptomyces sp. NPDC050610 TaxID=3157097 RepID=UPI00341D5033